MRAVHCFAIAAALALGATVPSMDVAPTRHVLQMAPPDDIPAQSRAPDDDGLKLPIGTALLAKIGAFFVLTRTGPEDLPAATDDGRRTAETAERELTAGSADKR